MVEKNPVTGQAEPAPEPFQKLTLATLGGRDINGKSGAEELFQEYLAEVLSNIARLDTDATAKREISLKIVFTPSADRASGAVEVTAACKLAPMNSANGKVAFGLVLGEHVAVPLVETLPLFNEVKAPAPTVLAKTGTDNK